MIERRYVFLRYGVPFLVYVTLIFSLSSLSVGGAVEKLPLSDKVIHFFEYSLLPVLSFRLFVFLQPWKKWTRHYFAAGIIISLVIAAADEWYQSHVPSRMMDAYDFLADSMGILTSALLWFVWRMYRKRRKDGALPI